MPKPPRPLAGALLLALLATGCAGATAGPANPPDRPAAPPASTESKKLTLPFDAYELSAADARTVESAEDELLRSCMRERGLAWKVLPRARAADLDPPHRRRYGVIEAEVARRYGFRPPPAPSGESRHKADLEARQKALAPKEARAAYGTDGTGGCWKRAHSRLQQGVPETDDSAFDNLVTRGFEASRRDREVLRALDAWRGCMRQAGFRYDDPLRAAADPRWEEPEGRASAEEIKAATADVRCKQETRLVAAWSAAESRLQEAAIRQHPALFRTLRSANQRLLGAAREVLGEKTAAP